MKPLLFLSALILALVASPLARAADTALEKEMKVFKSAFNQLKKQAQDSAQNASSRALVAKINAAATASLALEPEKTAELPEKDRAAFVAGYKEKMKTFIATLDKLDAALKAGDNVDAVRLVVELNSLQRADHKAFRKSEN